MMTGVSKNNWTNWHNKLHKDLLSNKELLPQNTNILIAVSGGQDSMALLSLMYDMKYLHNWEIDVWHGNHNWHQKSATFAEELKTFCAKKNINFHLDIAKSIEVSSEEKARDWRYIQLRLTAEKIRKQRNLKSNLSIITGHTSTDNAETFFLNLARGSKYNGLGGIKRKSFLEKKFSLIRPILIFSREDTKAICQSLSIPIWEDPTNLDLKIKRNFIRNEIIPKLEDLYPGFTSRVSVFIETMKNYHNEQLDLSKLALLACKEKNCINRILFNTLSKEARATILNLEIKEKCIKQISTKNLISFCDDIFLKNHGTIDLPNGFRLTWNNDLILVKD